MPFKEISEWRRDAENMKLVAEESAISGKSTGAGVDKKQELKNLLGNFDEKENIESEYVMESKEKVQSAKE